jgi:hypothetical protein
MDWSFDRLYGKARTYIHRAHDEPINSALFAFWTSLALELLCRAALAKIHPVLLADATSEGNIQYVFGIIPKTNPKSIQAKTVFARCSVFVRDFTDKMSAHCLIMADRRNSELHSGVAAFEGIDNSAWLPATYEVMEVLLRHIGTDFAEFLGKDHAQSAIKMLKDRRENIKREVFDRLSAAKKIATDIAPERRTKREESVKAPIAKWLSENALRRGCSCPACGSGAIMSGESISRGPARVDEDAATIQREVRVLPNLFRCPVCGLKLDGYQEMLEAGLGTIYTTVEDEDPIEFFGIVPEEHVDVEKLLREYHDDGYANE